MKEVVDGMQRRRSMQVEAIANVPEDAKDSGQQLEDDETLEDETAEESVPFQTNPREAARSFPATPHMSDLKHVFSENRAANMPPPSYAGVRRIFRAERAPNPETPRLDGVREMFFRAREREPSTPIFEGVDEMLATPAGYCPQETTQSDEVKFDSTADAHAPSPNAKRPREKSMVSDNPAKPSSRIAVKASGLQSMRDGREMPTDVAQLVDDELMPDAPLDKSSERAPKGPIVRRTNRRAETEAKEVIIVCLVDILGQVLMQRHPRTRPWRPPSFRARRGKS